MVRQARLEDSLHSIFSDCRFAIRQLRKSPGFAVAAALTLALGIGSTTAIFSVVNGALLNPYPYKNAERLATFTVIPLNNSGHGAFPHRRSSISNSRTIPLTTCSAWSGAMSISPAPV